MKLIAKAGLAVALMGGVFLSAGARTMTVASQEGNQVTLTFGGEDGNAYTLGVASGQADGGDDKYAWTDFERVATIAANQTHYTHTITNDQVRYLRFFLMQTENLPYAREIDYIQSTGTQYIDVGVDGYPGWNNAGTSMECDMAPMASGCDATFLGGRYNSSTDYPKRFFLCHLYGNNWCMGYGGFLNSGNGYTVGQKVHLAANLGHGSQWLKVDGVTKYSGSSTTSTTLNNYYYGMYLFAAHYNGASQYCQARLWNMTISQFGTLKRKFVPIVKTDGYGALYDYVSGSIYANKGSGSFTVGEKDASLNEPVRRGIVKVQTATLEYEYAKVPATAVWTNTASDGVYTNAANWICYNAAGEVLENVLPNTSTTVLLGGETSFSFPTGTGLNIAGFGFSSNVTLTADCDWRGVDLTKIAAGTIDLNGHTLRVLGANGESPNATIFTNSGSNGAGTLVCEVPSGATFNNTQIQMSSNLKFRKDGAGTFVAGKTQSYSAGTDVAAGTLSVALAGGSAPLGATWKKDTNPAVVHDGATLDLAVADYFTHYHFTLDGGTLRDACSGNVCIGDISLTKDSSLNLANGDIFIWPGYTWDFGGHTLAMNLSGSDPDVYMSVTTDLTQSDGVTFKNGTLKVTGTGWLQIYKLTATDNFTLDYSSILRLHSNSTIQNFINRSANGNVVSEGEAKMTITGTYTPLTQYGYNMQMANGSTINLSAEANQTLPYSTSITNTSGTTSCALTFAANAKVTVDLSGRAIRGKEFKVLAWTSRPDASVKFVPDASSSSVGASFRVKDDGLYACRPGLLIICL